MMESLQEYRAELLASVQVRAQADANFKHAAFVELCSELLAEAEEIRDFSPCYYRGKGTRRRTVAVDGFAFDDVDNTARMVIAHFVGGAELESLTRTDAKAQFSSLVSFVEDSIDGVVLDSTDESTPEHGLARELRTRSGDVSRYRFYLVTDRILSEKVRDWPDAGVRGIPAEFHIWDLSRFHRAHVSKSGRDDLVVNFTDFVPGGLPCLPVSVGADAYEGYLCVIPGTVLADIYELYGSRLLEGNVRAFLSTGGKVNKGIQQTLQREPEMFFAYNNGIAATASSVDIDGMRVTAAKDFQIVNGGQTTASMALARRKHASKLDGVAVQMKLSVVDDDQAGTFIPLISRFSNSQNKVSDADFFSNHEFHRRIESISRRLRAPATRGSQVETYWFYERARGQYSVELSARTNRGSAERKRFELEMPRSQIITKTDLAKVENSWRQFPHEVSRGAQKNFLKFAEHISEEWERSPDSFNDEYFRLVVARTILFHALEQLVPRQEWYDGGYRAQIVTYSIAKLAHLVEQSGGRTINFGQIWKEQALSRALTQQLESTALAAFKVVIAPEAGIQNVGEWCKKEIAWQRLTDVDVELADEFMSELVDAADVASRQRAAKEDAKVDAGVDAVKRVLEYGPLKWEQVRQWAAARRLLTSRDESLLRVALNPRWVPSDRQAKDLLKMLGRLDDEGFPLNS